MPARNHLLIAAALALLVVSGCATGPTPAGQARASGTSEHRPVPPTPADPEFAEALERRALLDAALGELTLREKVQSLLMLHHPGTSAAAVADLVREVQPGGLILMGDNVAGAGANLPAMLGALDEMSALPLVVGLDQEGGTVARLPDPGLSPWEARSSSPEQVEASAQVRAEMLAARGVTVNFGILADVTANTRSFLHYRVLGATPAAAEARVVASVEGERGLVASTLKHFPGHGSAAGDSHTSIPVSPRSLSEWEAADARPFIAGIDAGAEFVMMGHLAYPRVDAAPATVSAAWHRILRADLGFEGIIISDDMLMLRNSGDPRYTDVTAMAVAALTAGTTMLLYVLAADPAVSGVDPRDLVDDLEQAVADGRIAESVIDDAARRVLQMRMELAGTL